MNDLSSVKQYNDKDWLYNQYCNQSKSMLEIAKECNVTAMTIRNWLIKFNIPTRPITKPHKNKNKDWLYDQYWNQLKSMPEIAKECGVHHLTIRNWLIKFNIPTRSIVEAHLLIKKKYINDDDIKKIIKLRREYNTYIEIGNIMHIGTATITKTLKENMHDYMNYVGVRQKSNKERKKEKYNKKMLDIREKVKNDELTSEKACIIVACEPTVKHFLDNIVDNLPDHIDIEKTKQMIKEIEKKIFKINIYRQKKIVIATALYLANPIAQSIASKLGVCTSSSIRNLLKNLPKLKHIKELQMMEEEQRKREKRERKEIRIKEKRERKEIEEEMEEEQRKREKRERKEIRIEKKKEKEIRIKEKREKEIRIKEKREKENQKKFAKEHCQYCKVPWWKEGYLISKHWMLFHEINCPKNPKNKE